MKKNSQDNALNQKNSRRDFFKTAALSLTAFFLLPSTRKKSLENLAFGADLKPLAETDPLATAMAYKADGAKSTHPKRSSSPDGKTQFCNNCMFYTNTDGKTGKCQIFPNNVVMSKGWCSSWAKKA